MIILAILFAVGLSLGFAAGKIARKKQTQGASIDPQPILPEMVEVVVMLQTVPEGFILTENVLATDIRLAESVPRTVITPYRRDPNLYTVNYDDISLVDYFPVIDDIIGQPARFDLYQGLTLTTDMIGPRTYHALMTNQSISKGTPITGDMVRYVAVPYDNPNLTTDTIVHNDRLWLVDMTAAWDLAYG